MFLQKSLDLAKKNLTNSITTLRRLHMLVTGVGQLKTMAAKRQYKEVGSLLQAVASLSICFDDFHHLPRIAEAQREFEALKQECSNLVYSEFEALEHHAPTPPFFGDLCAVMEALGKTERLHFMSWFVKDRLSDYEQSFGEGGIESFVVSEWDFCSPGTHSSPVQPRVQWLKRELQFYHEHFEATFPPAWEMPQLLCEEFCLVTKDRLAKVLSDLRTKDKLSVAVLLDTMKGTIAFEKELNKRFSPGGAAHTPATLAGDSGRESSDAIRRKYNPAAGGGGAGAPAPASGPCTRFNSIIRCVTIHHKARPRCCCCCSPLSSSVFMPHLDIYVAYADRTTREMLSSVTKADEFEERNKVYTSSQTLFEAYKGIMDTCAGLSRGAAFFQVAEMFRAHLRSYGDYLMGRVSSANSAPDAEKVVCFAINTSEYCSGNTEKLGETIQQRIEPEWATKVDFAAEGERFQTVVARGCDALVQLLQARIAPSLARMQRLDWMAADAVVDQSEYVTGIAADVRDCSAKLKQYLSNARYLYWCDSFVIAFVPALRDSVFQCRAISEVGAEQLLLDVAHIKQALDAMPGARAPARFKRIVEKSVHKMLERLLKVLMAPVEATVDSYLALVAKGTPHELQQLLQLKGVKRADQVAEMLDQFKRKRNALAAASKTDQ